MPDLIVKSSSINASSLTEGSDFSVNFTIKNQGEGAAAASNVGIYFCESTVFDASTAVFHTDASMSSLAAGASSSESVSFSLPAALVTGTYYVFVVANDGDTITESNYTNDVSGWDELTVTAPQLFTTGADTVNFNVPYLTSNQIAAIIAGADKYDGLGGNNVVTLPTEANETESLGDGETLGWHDSLNSLFHTDSLAGQNYTVNGDDGDYYINCGAGNDTINIDNLDPSVHTSYNTIVGGSGDNVVNILNCNGDNTVTAGTGPLQLNINGYGNNKLQVEGPSRRRFRETSRPRSIRISPTMAHSPSSSCWTPPTLSRECCPATAISTLWAAT